MRVLVAGSTGVLGRATVEQLCARGHQVVALVRSEEQARLVPELRAAQLVPGDLLDAGVVREAAAEVDAVMHLATAIPKMNRPAPADWENNDQLRREGTHNLIEAVRGRPLHAFVQQSVAFLYGDRGTEWITEDEPPHPPPHLQSAVEGERLVLAAYDESGLPAVVLRGATLYGAEAWSTRSMLNAVKRRQFAIIGTGEQYWHYIYVKDLASALVLAVENPAPGEVFFVADDWPFHSRDLLDYLAVQLNVAAPPQLPYAIARLTAGPRAALLSQSARFRTDKLKRMLGWAPRYPTYREGFAEILPLFGVRPK